MLKPRFSDAEIVATAQLVAPADVTPGDPRLVFLDEALCRQTAATFPPATFLAWPDMTLGFTLLLYAEEPRRSEVLINAYRVARESLERLALDYFYLYGATRPQ